jgi:dTDP-4-amino-4,6-dideoxygalactose transaminase
MQAYRGYARGALPATESVYARILCVPIYNDLAPADQERVTDIVRAHYRGPRAR